MKKVKIQKRFVHYEALKYWEQVIVAIYGLLTFVIILSPFILRSEARQNLIIAYAILPQLSFYGFLYVSLRNFRSYLIWLCFAIVHFIVFLWFKHDAELDMGMANPAYTLANTLPLLLLFQLLRYFSRRVQHREFVSPAKGGGTDLIEGKEVTGVDYLIFIIYMVTWFGLSVFCTYY